MNQPLVRNAADKEQVKGAKRKEKSRRENEVVDTQYILSSFNGRRFLWRYLELCGVFKTSFSPESSQAAFNEGQRNVGLRLLSDINEANPDAYLQMMKESKGDKYV